MTKFQKIQKISSVIPFWSTMFISIITMIELKRRAAPKKLWFYFILTLFSAVIVVYLLNIFMSGKNPLLNIIATGLALTIANILLVDFQVMSTQTQQPKPAIIVQPIVVICCLVAVFMSIITLLFTLFSPAVAIEDTNGKENTSLAVIEISELLATDDNYSAFSSNISHKGPHTNVNGKLKDYDYQECSFRSQKISGVMTLQATKTKSEQITLEISSQLEEGNMEIIIIVDGEYYDHVPANKDCLITMTDIAEKTVVVRMGAESAKLEVSVKRMEQQ